MGLASWRAMRGTCAGRGRAGAAVVAAGAVGAESGAREKAPAGEVEEGVHGPGFEFVPLDAEELFELGGQVVAAEEVEDIHVVEGRAPLAALDGVEDLEGQIDVDVRGDGLATLGPFRPDVLFQDGRVFPVDEPGPDQPEEKENQGQNAYLPDDGQGLCGPGFKSPEAIKEEEEPGAEAPPEPLAEH